MFRHNLRYEITLKILKKQHNAGHFSVILNILLIFKLLFENFGLILHKDLILKKIKITTNRFMLRKQFTMQRSFFTALLLFAFSLALPAQSPLYIQFDPKCMNQLEYQYTYSGQNLLMYSIAKSSNELYFFLLANTEAVTTSTLPKGTVSCQNAPLNTSLMESINAGGRTAYVVFRVQNGYRSMKIESGGYVTRSGTYFAFRSPNYDFVMDTANVDYARNLSQPGVVSPVYLTGMRAYDCLKLYAFRLEPVSPESPRADVEVIPGIGIISDRTGRNGSEMEQNVYRLLRVNGMSLDDYIYTSCNHLAQPGGNDGTFITHPSDNPDPYDPFFEPDKEVYNPTPGKPGQGGGGQFVNCPEKPGYGYHIVQPGESLITIARIYSLSPSQLIAWNNIKDANRIEVCDKIWLSQQAGGVPAPGGQTANYHVVQKGETLVGIARKYNLTEASIRQLNKLPSSGNVIIQPGQRIIVSKTTEPAQGIGAGTGGTPQPGVAPNPMLHSVKRGETLTGIAQQYGYTTHYFRHINRANQNLLAVRDEDFLPEGLMLTASDSKERIGFSNYTPPTSYSQLGQRFAPANTGTPDPGIYTPPSAQQGRQSKFEYIGEHIVIAGETLASIAARYKVSAEKLAAANNLQPGQEPQARSILKIPK